MELDELKSNWLHLSDQLATQQKLQRKLVEDITDLKFTNHWHSIAWPEFAGSILCLAAAVFVGWKFAVLQNFLLRVLGVASILLLVIIPLLSYLSLQKLKNMQPAAKSYLQTLKKYSTEQLSFVRIQGVIKRMGIFLLIVYIPVFTLLSTGIDISTRLSYWLLILPICSAFYFVVAKKVGNQYINKARTMQSLFTNIDDES